MITDVCQRWSERRGVYRPAREVIDTSAYEVAPIADDATFDSIPAGDHKAKVELGRFVLDPGVLANGETWFLGRTFDLLRKEGIIGVVSFSDQTERTNAAGDKVFGGHVGGIYQGHNANYRGRGTARVQRLLPDGTVLSPRTIQKIRAGERGWEYGVAQLEAAGASPLVGDRRAWVAAQIERVTRPLRHPGNHKYVWGLERAVRRSLAPSLPYPKFDHTPKQFELSI
jgi:hypothetical protein